MIESENIKLISIYCKNSHIPLLYLSVHVSLQWRHNERDCISNQRRLDCSLNCFFRGRSKKASKLCFTGLCHRSPVNSPNKGPVTRKIWWRHHVMLSVNQDTYLYQGGLYLSHACCCMYGVKWHKHVMSINSMDEMTKTSQMAISNVFYHNYRHTLCLCAITWYMRTCFGKKPTDLIKRSYCLIPGCYLLVFLQQGTFYMWRLQTPHWNGITP